MRFVRTTLLIGVIGAGVTLAAQTPGVGWLDRPLVPWNRPEAGGVPVAAMGEARDALLARCPVTSPRSGPGLEVTKAGWVAFLPFDRPIANGDIEVVGGMRAATESCAPARFNLFVFAGGRYAGTLSPVEMTTGADGVIGAVRLPPGDVVTAEFARYATSDSECCPSGRVRVTYRIDRRGAQPVIVPVDVRKLRG